MKYQGNILSTVQKGKRSAKVKVPSQRVMAAFQIQLRLFVVRSCSTCYGHCDYDATKDTSPVIALREACLTFRKARGDITCSPQRMRSDHARPQRYQEITDKLYVVRAGMCVHHPQASPVARRYSNVCVFLTYADETCF